MNTIVLPLALAATILFVGSLGMSLILLRKLPISICVETGIAEAKPFLVIGRVSREGGSVKCFENIEELYEFCSGAGIKLIELRKSISVLVALKKALLSIAALSALGIAMSLAIVAVSLSLGA